MLVRIPHDPSHTRQSGEFVWRTLRVAACDQNAAAGILPLQAPNRCPRILVGTLGNRTGVEDDDFSFASFVRSLQPALEELVFERCSVGLSRSASKILYVEAAHAPILPEWVSA